MHVPIDPIGAVTQPDPYPGYVRLAAHRAPVYDERLRLWVAAHPDTVREALAHPDCRVRPLREPVPAAIEGPAGDLFGALVRMNDGVRHAGPKAALMRALAALPPAQVAACADRVVTPLAVRATDAHALNRYVFAAPVRTMAALLGAADAQLAAFEEWTACYVAGVAPQAPPDAIRRAHEAVPALLAALRDLVAAPQKSALLGGLLAADWPDEHTLLANVAGLLTQTYEATAGLLGNGVVALLQDPSADRTAVAAQVAASDPAIHNTRRFAASDVRIGATQVGTGDAILLVLAGTLPFGAGRHECPGQAVARTLVERALWALPPALPGVAWRYRLSLNARIPFFIEQEPA